MRWIAANPNTLQVLSTVSVAFLTLILIIVNVIYTRANWRIMQLMATDLRLRSQPIPKIDHSVASAGATPNLVILIDLRTENAPMKIISLVTELEFSDESKVGIEAKEFKDRILPLGETFRFRWRHETEKLFEDYVVTLRYSDIAGIGKYESKYDRDEDNVQTSVLPK